MDAWGLSDTGKVRKQNQDYYNLIPFGAGCLLAIVCDGMGGAKSGNVASRLAADAFCAEVRRNIRSDLLVDDVKRIMTGALELANRAVYEHAHRNGFGVVREYCGHGVGLKVHEDPEIPNYVSHFSANPRVREGMVLAIEPMINLGKDGIIDMPDGLTVITADGKPSAHWEHTVAITANGPEILTQL